MRDNFGKYCVNKLSEFSSGVLQSYIINSIVSHSITTLGLLPIFSTISNQILSNYITPFCCLGVSLVWMNRKKTHFISNIIPIANTSVRIISHFIKTHSKLLLKIFHLEKFKSILLKSSCFLKTISVKLSLLGHIIMQKINLIAHSILGISSSITITFPPAFIISMVSCLILMGITRLSFFIHNKFFINNCIPFISEKFVKLHLFNKFQKLHTINDFKINTNFKKNKVNFGSITNKIVSYRENGKFNSNLQIPKKKERHDIDSLQKESIIEDYFDNELIDDDILDDDILDDDILDDDIFA